LVLSLQAFSRIATKPLDLLGSSLVEAWTKQEKSKSLCKQSPFFSAFSDVGDRCSAGKTKDGQKYQETHPNWQQGVVSPWYDFLRLRHRK
jgi:hypothetical protein